MPIPSAGTRSGIWQSIILCAVSLGGLLGMTACGGGGGGGGTTGQSPAAPSIVTQPKNASVTAGQSVTFSVTATGAGPLTYQWAENGAAISGATSASFTLPSAAKSDDRATITVAVTNAGGTTSSAAAILTVTGLSAASGVAQKGPFVKGSTVTAQELDVTLSPAGAQYSYKVNSNFGTFSPASAFYSPFIGVSATGYYFDEIANAVSSGTVTLNAYSDLTSDSVLNVNVLTSLEYQRIQNLVTQLNMGFTAARTQAENEVLSALNIPTGNYGSFDTLDLSGNTDGDHVLAAISSLFTYGKSAGQLNQLIANFQSDIGTNGFITNPATAATLAAAAKGINPSAVAANLTHYYAGSGSTFTAANISDWIAQSGDGVIGKFAFQVADATPSTVFAFPSAVVAQFAGTPVSVTAGQLVVNGTAVSAATFNPGDAVTLSPNIGDFPNGVLSSYLVTGSKNLARVSFISGLVSIAVTPGTPGVPKGLMQQFTATGTFSDTSTADLTNTVVWSSDTPNNATINAGSGLANALAVGTAVITAKSGSVSGSVTLTVTPAIVEAIAVAPSPAITGIGMARQLTATGTYSDSSIKDVTTSAAWTSDTPTVAAVGPTTGLVTGVAGGSANISATIGSVTGMAPLSVVSQVWVASGDMSTARQFHTATLLPSGKVLVTGGYNGIASADIYDPATGTWSATGTMTTPRWAHTATLLANGTVLVAGGETSTTNLASAEIYDPATGAWTATGSMAGAHIFHSATLLPNGTVLVAGGSGRAGGPGVSDSAELYDPATGTWSVTGNMSADVSSQTATLLSNGTVLVTGGLVSGAAVTDAEVYDPVAGTWNSTGSLEAARADHTATLLPGGKVMVVGGYTYTGTSPWLSSAEVYDPVVGTWSYTGSMLTSRRLHTATLLANGTVLAAGGETGPTVGSDTPLASAELYDPSTGGWSATGSLTETHWGHTATLLPDGTTLVAGPTDGSELYYP
jgi:Bacterial Ig-like domain (group 2)/Immunoglobulin I-set domain/Galactose oxidase, central domain/Kelch motif